MRRRLTHAGTSDFSHQMDLEDKSVQQEETYGAIFVKHLTALGKSTPFNYKDLQQVKAMTQADLADWLRVECREFSQVILESTPDAAAAAVHKKRTEMAAANEGPSTAQSAELLLELIANLFTANY